MEGGARVAMIEAAASDERGRPGRAAQDARGTARRGDDHPVRGRRGPAAADHPVPLRSAPAGSRRRPRRRGDPRRPRPDRRPTGRPARAAVRRPARAGDGLCPLAGGRPLRGELARGCSTCRRVTVRPGWPRSGRAGPTALDLVDALDAAPRRRPSRVAAQAGSGGPRPSRRDRHPDDADRRPDDAADDAATTARPGPSRPPTPPRRRGPHRGLAGRHPRRRARRRGRDRVRPRPRPPRGVRRRRRPPSTRRPRPASSPPSSGAPSWSPATSRPELVLDSLVLAWPERRAA